MTSTEEAAAAAGRLDDDDIVIESRTRLQPPADAAARSVEHVLRNIALIVAPASIVTAMLYYFGWVRTNAIATVYGIDGSLLAFSADDYVLRSVPSLFLPVGTAVLGSLASMQLDSVIWSMLYRKGASSKALRNIGSALTAAGWVAVAWGGWRLREIPADRPVYLTPALLGFGAMAVGYGMVVRHRSSSRASDAAFPPSMLALLVALAIVAAFTATFRYADAEGRGQAVTTIRELPLRPEVSLLSRYRLQLPSALVTTTELGATGERDYAFRSSGLRLLTRNDGKFFLVPACFGRTNWVVMIVPDDNVRLEFDSQPANC